MKKGTIQLKKSGALFLVFALLTGLLPSIVFPYTAATTTPPSTTFAITNVTVKQINADNFDKITFTAPQDYGLSKANISVTDNTRPGLYPMTASVSYDSGTYTVEVNELSYFDTYTLTITKDGYSTYQNTSVYYGTIATAADIDIASEKNIFDNYTRSYDPNTGVLTVSNNTYAAGAVLYDNGDLNSLYYDINNNNGNPIGSASEYRVIGAFAVAPTDARYCKSLSLSGVMKTISDDSLIDQNPNHEETVADGSEGSFANTVYAFPAYLVNAVRMEDQSSWMLFDQADRVRVIEWYDASWNLLKAVRFTVKVEYKAGGATKEAPASYPALSSDSGTVALSTGGSLLLPSAVVSGFGGSWGGASISATRVNADISNYFYLDSNDNDIFTITTNSVLYNDTIDRHLYSYSGSSIGLRIADWTLTGGVLTVTFNTDATDADVTAVLQHIQYSNETPYGDALICLSLSDGTNTAYSLINVTSDTIYVDQTALDQDCDARDGYNLAEALLKAEDGDTILIQDGTYRGQFLATKAVTIDAANGEDGDVTLESPDTADLVKSEQDIMKANGTWRMPILELRLDDPESGEIEVSNLKINGRFQSVTGLDSKNFIGIAVFNTSAVIDHVTVYGIAEALTDDDDADNDAEEYSGISINFGILAEGASNLSARAEVTVKNSVVREYQKCGIIAWGPMMHINILDNTITANGEHDHCGQNGIQIASAGLRTSTTATISGNTIRGIGFDDPSESYVGSGVILWQAGAVELSDNNISGTSAVYPHVAGVGTTFGVAVYLTADTVNIHDNTFGSMQYGVFMAANDAAYYGSHLIQGNDFSGAYFAVYDSAESDEASYDEENEETITVTSDADAVDNTIGYLQYMLFGGDDSFQDTGDAPSHIYAGAGSDTVIAGNGNDTIAGGAGNDTLTGSSGYDVFSYDASGNDLDTITDFSSDDTIRVNSCNFTGGTVTSGSGTSVGAGSVQMSTSGGLTTLYIDTDGTLDEAELQIVLSGTYSPSYFTLNSTDITYSPTSDSGSTHSSAASTGAVVKVNGVEKSAGTSSTSTNSEGQSVTTVTVNTAKLEGFLASEEDQPVVTIPVTDDSDVARGVLTGAMIKNMENRDATLVIETDSVSYRLPASEIDIDAIAAHFGNNVEPSEITVSVTVSQLTDEETKVVQNTEKDGEFTIQIPAVSFTVTCTYQGKTVEVDTFGAYVQRLIRVPDGVDPNQITTGVIIPDSGEPYHVPTEIVLIDGVYYAKINSLTDSVYAVVWHPLEFADAAGHWAEEAINDMGSRMVVTGDENGSYNPDKDITRAEFATIVVRALGLAPGTGDSGFLDVSSSSWYCGYVKTASAYGIIKGYHADSFGPGDSITREQAMTMIARAMTITGLSESLTAAQTAALLDGYEDGASVSDFARDGIAECLDTGVVTGTDGHLIAPGNFVTRAEVAVMIQRLLNQSDLI